MNIPQFIYTAITWMGLLVAMISAGCATQSKSLALGGAMGAGAGAIAGGIADPGKDGQHRTRNVVIGSALGGMAGMVTGDALYKSSERQKVEAFQAGKKSGSAAPLPGEMPALSEPKVEARWVDSKVVGNRFIDGHFEYLITEPTRWQDSK